MRNKKTIAALAVLAGVMLVLTGVLLWTIGPFAAKKTEETTTVTTTESTTAATTTTETTTVPTTTESTTETTTETTTEATTTKPKDYDLTGMVVCLDPGHQLHADYGTEPLAPWSDEMKTKVSSGTVGVATKRPEHEVNLEIGLRIRDYLEEQGATVVMTRTEADVKISNIERANVALNCNSDVYIRIHCDDAENSSVRGVGVFVCSRGELAESLVTWGKMLGNCMSEATGAKFRGCYPSTNYSGLNWCTSIPAFLLELGYMSNAEDDRLLSDPDYQAKICRGVAAFCLQMKDR